MPDNNQGSMSAHRFLCLFNALSCGAAASLWTDMFLVLPLYCLVHGAELHALKIDFSIDYPLSKKHLPIY